MVEHGLAKWSAARFALAVTHTTCPVTKMRARSLLVCVFTVCCLVGCQGTAEPEGVRRVAEIAHHGDLPHVVAPDTVIAGVPFEVTVRTYHGGCEGVGDTEVAVSEGVVSLRPYTIYRPPAPPGPEVDGVGCYLEEVMVDRRVTVALVHPGPVVFRVYGLERPSDSAIVVERRLVVN